MPPRDKLSGRFSRVDPKSHLYANIAIDEQTKCWNWTGNLFAGGYGAFKCKAITSRQINASRASWILHFGPISKSEFVCHHCDNRACCNPAHLFLGSAKDNMEDCKEKGRINKGEDRPQHKLTEEDVRTIRRLRQEGYAWRGLAAKFGVARTCVVSAATGKTWAHVDEPLPTYVGIPGRPSTS